MLESAWLFVGTVSVIWTVLTIGAAVYLENDDNFQIMTGDSFVTLMGAVGTVSWGVWTYGTLDVTAVADSTTHAFTMPGVTVLGIAFAFIPFVFFLTGPINLARGARAPTPDEI